MQLAQALGAPKPQFQDSSASGGASGGSGSGGEGSDAAGHAGMTAGLSGFASSGAPAGVSTSSDGGAAALLAGVGSHGRGMGMSVEERERQGGGLGGGWARVEQEALRLFRRMRGQQVLLLWDGCDALLQVLFALSLCCLRLALSLCSALLCCPTCAGVARRRDRLMLLLPPPMVHQPCDPFVTIYVSVWCLPGVPTVAAGPEAAILPAPAAGRNAGGGGGAYEREPLAFLPLLYITGSCACLCCRCSWNVHACVEIMSVHICVCHTIIPPSSRRYCL